jgi:hypothetical protein
VRYWDTSALLPLVVREKGTDPARRWFAQDPHVVTWGLSRVEIVSALERRVREGRIDREQRRETLRRFARLFDAWHEVTDIVLVRGRAQSILARQALRAADACQIGAALVTAEDDPSAIEFVSLDRRLGEAAEKEGFRVLSWTG